MRWIVAVALLSIGSFARGAELAIQAPGEPVEVKEAVQMFVEGLESEALPTARVLLWPRDGVQLIPAKTWGDVPFLWFQSKRPGVFWVAVVVPIAGDGGKLSTRYAEAVLEVDNGNGDDDEPDPGPDPDPDPPTPTGKSQILIFFESDELDEMPLEQRVLVTGLVFRKALEERGHKFVGAFDASSVVDVPDVNMETWLRAIEGDRLPRLCVAPKAGGRITDYPLPANAEELFALLEGE